MEFLKHFTYLLLIYFVSKIRNRNAMLINAYLFIYIYVGDVEYVSVGEKSERSSDAMRFSGITVLFVKV